ncbi:MAG: carbamoyl phosphate synthase small subunit [Cyanobacteria bacterium QS_8_64_29]|nr:MAG: carbamoyl phosphate synthase small subunit [Cyanobacteria bacterium QS_8_64_29]
MSLSALEAPPALLVLADGSTYWGRSFGAPGTIVGEVVFNTGMTGYQEVLTDPSYRGQIVTFTYPELGNTGVTPEDDESAGPQARGAIARNVCYAPSSWRARDTLPNYLQQHGIPGIYGVDTRAIVRRIRSLGAMNGGISTEIRDPEHLLQQVRQAPDMAGLNLVWEVTTPHIYEWSDPSDPVWEFRPAAGGSDSEPLTVVALDLGLKRNQLRRLASYGCRIIVVPADTPAQTIRSYQPDGLFLSNGPGDPATVTETIETARELYQGGCPTFGICMGHQLLGLSLGGKSFKLKFGHRGLNQPAGRPQQVEITSQNHGFAIAADSLQGRDDIEITHRNLNDRTVAGLRHKSLPVFSVQYHPEASPGPHDADYLFERFVALMRLQRARSGPQAEAQLGT